MHVHLVVAHPEKSSFNYALHRIAIEALNSMGIRYSESNLYADSFNPVAGHNDVIGIPDGEPFNLAKAQRFALENNAFISQIKHEQNKLKECDVLVLQFPLWWWSFPAILKGWIDRVLTSGFAYGEGATLKAKKVMYSITTGGAKNQSELDYYQAKIDGLYQDVFAFMGWEIIPPFIAHGVQQKSHQQRLDIIASYTAHIQKKLTLAQS
ncbi:NAD(P)H-dependent oxidoreductase [Pseudoalteromonas luteoviolacea]|nr:NAD(P)H-dependent oxidoreductase [Pseudoalteromonas luteoviolacea]MBQ4837971.1 NAD(P)H-dependent oxidoreductase [Pseudoalteromonas luteoviolacea]